MDNVGFVRGGLHTALADDGDDSKQWELRPSGMVVQVRDTSADDAGPIIKVKVSYAASTQELSVGAYSTFGDLKKALVEGTGLEPNQQRLLYRGKERDNRAYLRDAGIKNKSKIVLIEDPMSQQKKLMESRREEAIVKACKSVADIHEEVDKLAEKVFSVEAAVKSGRRLRESAITEATELLMSQLLKLDGIKAEGNAKSQRRILVRRIQKYVETLDALKLQNGSSKSHSKTIVTTKWETFDTAFGGPSVSSSPHQHNNTVLSPQSTSSAPVLHLTNWERFD